MDRCLRSGRVAAAELECQANDQSADHAGKGEATVGASTVNDTHTSSTGIPPRSPAAEVCPE